MPDTSSHADAPARIRLVAASASEAVAQIRRRFGEQAKVVSVTQIPAAGLKRYFSKPKLEIVVEAPKSLLRKPDSSPRSAAAAAKSEAPARKPQQSAQPAAASPQPPSEAPDGDSNPREPAAPAASAPEKPASRSAGYFAALDDSAGDGGGGDDIAKAKTAPRQRAEEAEPAQAPSLGSAANPVRRGRLEAARRAVSLLQAAGFDPSLVERIRGDLDLDNLGAQPAAELCRRISRWLRAQFPDRVAGLSGRRRAFIGGFGAGKTSALCKALAAEVFVRGRDAAVLKLDGDTPNPSDGLEAFCEILGVSLYRSSSELASIEDGRPVYVDMPGFDLADPAAIDECIEILDAEGIDERVLVANAAYDSELLADAFSAAERFGAARFVLTHMDEARRVGKLWKYLLNGRFQPLFFSHGPNPAGDYATETYAYLLQRSFPESQAQAPAPRSRAHAAEEAATR